MKHFTTAFFLFHSSLPFLFSSFPFASNVMFGFIKCILYSRKKKKCLDWDWRSGIIYLYLGRKCHFPQTTIAHRKYSSSTRVNTDVLQKQSRKVTHVGAFLYLPVTPPYPVFSCITFPLLFSHSFDGEQLSYSGACGKYQQDSMGRQTESEGGRRGIKNERGEERGRRESTKLGG